MNQEYTGRIENWVHDKKQGVIIGDLYDDKRGRWIDGAKIMTSKLAPMSMQISTPKEGVIVMTRNSSYLLGVKKS